MNVFNFGLRLKHNVKIVNAVSSFRMHLCIWHAFQNVCAPCYSGWHSRNHSRSTFKSRPGHLFPAAHWALPILALCSGRILSRALESAPALALWTGPVWAWSVSAQTDTEGSGDEADFIRTNTLSLWADLIDSTDALGGLNNTCHLKSVSFCL